MSLDGDALALLCIQVPQLSPTDVCIPFPGGGNLCPQQGIQLGDASAMIQSLMSSANAALLPLQPFFTIIQTVKAIVDCVQAIPDTLGPPPDPTAILQCIPPLLEQLEKLLQLLPQYSVPLLVKRLILVVATTLFALKTELQAVINYQAQITASLVVAAQPGNELLASIIDCATQNADATLANLQASMGPMAGLIAIVDTLLGLIGVDGIGGPPDLSGSAEDALAPLDDFIELLTTIGNAIPG